jgi:hypothetical protein
VEQPAAGRLEDVGPPAKVDGGSTTEMEGDHVVGLKEECRLGGTLVERPSRPRQRPLLPLSSIRAQQASSCSMEALTSSFKVQP